MNIPMKLKKDFIMKNKTKEQVLLINCEAKLFSYEQVAKRTWNICLI